MTVKYKGRWTALLAVACLWWGLDSAGAKSTPNALTADQFFQLTNVWTAHFTFTIDEWRAMNPTVKPFGGGNPTRPGRGGPNLTGPVGGRNGLAAARGVVFKYGQADLEMANTRLNKVAVRFKGNGTFFRSQNALKKSLKVDLNDTERDQKLAGQTKLNFHSNVSDPSWMLEPLSYRFYRDAGVPAPRTSYAKVYVTAPDLYKHKYFGLYSLVENVDKHFLKANFGSKDGAIFKPVGPYLFVYKGEDWSAYKQQYDPKTDLTPAQSQRMIDFCKLITSPNDREFAEKIASFIDLDEFSRFMAATVCLSSLDSILGMSQNFYMVLHPKSNKFLFIPWDLDNSFGKFRMSGTQEDREQLSIMEPWQGDNRFIARMFQVPLFVKLYRGRVQEFSFKLFKPERLGKQEEELAKVIRQPIAEESTAKLELFNKALAGESVSPDFGKNGRGGGGGWMNSAIKPIKPFVAARTKSLEDQLTGKSKGKIVSRNTGKP
jgi:spore coat protein H